MSEIDRILAPVLIIAGSHVTCRKRRYELRFTFLMDAIFWAFCYLW